MPDLEAALLRIEQHGSDIDKARLHFVLTGDKPAGAAIASWFNEQHADGGFAAFWSNNASSVDATCYQLTVMAQLGVDRQQRSTAKALDFLASVQRPDGSWEESESLQGDAPPWAKPGHVDATCYLTANCGWVLARFNAHLSCVERAAGFLQTQMDPVGNRLPSFLNTHWLALALFHQVGLSDQVNGLSSTLQSHVRELSAADLAWLLDSLTSVGLAADRPLLRDAALRLGKLQHEDGRWLDNSLDCTLQSLISLMRLGEFENHPFFN